MLKTSKTNFQHYFKTMYQRYLIEYTIIIANTFNVFFTNIGDKLANGIDYVSNIDYTYYLNKEIRSSFTLVNIDEAMVKKTNY